MDFYYKKFGEKLKIIRKEQNYTQKQVNESIGVGTDTLWRLENGLVEPTLHNLEKLSVFYKTDLLKLLLEYRVETSLLSKELITRTNELIVSGNIERLQKELETIKTVLFEEAKSNTYVDNATGLLTTYFDILKNLTDTDIKHKESVTVELEQSLQTMSKKKNILSDIYLYELEITVAILLSIVYRKNKQLDESLTLLEALEKNLIERDYPKDFKSSYLGTVLYNKSIIYHRLNEDQKVLDTVNEALGHIEIYSRRQLINLLLFRKGIAMFLLGDDNYTCILYTVLTLATGDELKNFKHAIFNIYGIDSPNLIQFND